MIQAEFFPPTLKALHRLLVHARSRAYNGESVGVGDFLDSFELLPECLADENDRTDEVIEMLRGLAMAHPDCRYIVEEFDRAAALP
jgi:hypothetical protein